MTRTRQFLLAAYLLTLALDLTFVPWKAELPLGSRTVVQTAYKGSAWLWRPPVFRPSPTPPTLPADFFYDPPEDHYLTIDWAALTLRTLALSALAAGLAALLPGNAKPLKP